VAPVASRIVSNPVVIYDQYQISIADIGRLSRQAIGLGSHIPSALLYTDRGQPLAFRASGLLQLGKTTKVFIGSYTHQGAENTQGRGVLQIGSVVDIQYRLAKLTVASQAVSIADIIGAYDL